MKPMPAPLSPHGTAIRAAICSDDCPDCGPVREATRSRSRRYFRDQSEPARWWRPGLRLSECAIEGCGRKRSSQGLGSMTLERVRDIYDALIDGGFHA